MGSVLHLFDVVLEVVVVVASHAHADIHEQAEDDQPGGDPAPQLGLLRSVLGTGAVTGAENASKQAKLWCQITTGLCIFGLLLNIGMRIAGYDGTAYWKNLAERMEQRR